MTRRSSYAVRAISIVIACLCGGVFFWRLTAVRPGPAKVGPNVQGEAAAKPQPTPTGKPRPTAKVSTTMDLPRDPVLVRRGDTGTPPKDLLISVPAKLSQDVPKLVAQAYFVDSKLVSTTGGYMGKFQESDREADALAVQFFVNSAQTQAQIEAGSDDDGGQDTLADAQRQILTSANSNQLEVRAAGSRGLPQLKETVLRTPVAEKISDLLIDSGYAEESARMIESAAKESSFHIETLPPQSVAIAVGQLDVTGEYRVKQIAIFENGEYVVTIAWKDDGGYDEAAEPVIPAGLLHDSGWTVDVATRFTLADGLYSAGMRNGMPASVIREVIQLVSPLADLRSPLQTDEAMRVLFQRDFRDKARSTGNVVYVGLHGGAVSADCYSFEGSDGYFRCFDSRASESKGGEPKRRAAPASFGNSGATSVGGILAPIKGAPVTALFGMRFHPILHILRLHAGIDFGAPVGSQVRAAADGKVEIAGPVSGFGNHIRIQHAGFETSYSHLSEIPESIKPGVEVKKGDVIALSGDTGLSTGTPHLHFEFYLNGEAVDPLPYLGAEIQSAAAALRGSMVATTAVANGSSASSDEIAQFTAMKAYIDYKLAEVMK